MEHVNAKLGCFARAYHYRTNSFHVFSDPAAEQLLGPEYEEISQSLSQGIGCFLPKHQGSTEELIRLFADRVLSPSVLGTCAYIEKTLENEIRLGCRQYVVFAAEYDTYAIRNRTSSLSVYELGLPETLAARRSRLETTGLYTTAVSVPCDLTDASWTGCLTGSGFRAERKTFAAMPGISFDMSRESFRCLLTELGSVLCGGSAICFDYPARENSRKPERYSYRELEALLEECGFLIYEHLDHTEMAAGLFSEYNRRYPERKMTAPACVCCVLAVKEKRGTWHE